MTPGMPWHLPRRISALVVLGVALVASLVLGTAAPHLHLDREPAFFNEEHDLTLLASAIDPKIEEWPVERLSHYRARWVWPPTFKNGPEWPPFVEDIRASGIR